MTKKERVVAAINRQEVDSVPSCFSLHFPQGCEYGDSALRMHLDFFEQTDTDILKIMNENLVPSPGPILRAADYRGVSSIGRGDRFIQRQLDLTKGLLDRCGSSAFTLGTLHGITASTIHPMMQQYGYDGSREAMVRFLREDKAPVLDAMNRIAEGLLLLIEAYADLGVDGIYYAALGGEHRYFTTEEFEEYIRPLDELLLAAIGRSRSHCFLHICKDDLDMERYRSYRKYADVVNWGVYEAPCSLEEGRALFDGVPIMGGLRSHGGSLTGGPLNLLEEEICSLICSFGRTGFLLGADCTLPTETPYERIAAAVWAARSC